MTLFHSQQNAPADIPLIRDVILTCRLAGGPSHSWFENIDYVTRADDLEALNTYYILLTCRYVTPLACPMMMFSVPFDNLPGS